MADPHRCRVLIVEDSYFLASDAARALRRERMEVLTLCASVADAFAVLAKQEPDCAVLDINLGDGATFELADGLRERAIPFLFYTGYDRGVIPSRFSEVACLHKPAKAQQLVEAIARLKRPA